MPETSPSDLSDRLKLPEQLPVLPLRDTVVFPFIIMPLSVARESSKAAVDAALAENRTIFLVAQRDKDIEDPLADDLMEIGTAAVIMRMLKLPDQRIRILVQGIARARLVELSSREDYLVGRCEKLEEKPAAGGSLEKDALIKNVRKGLDRSASLGKPVASEVMVVANNMENPGRLADLAASNLDLRVEEAQEVLSLTDPLERLRRVNEMLYRELELLAMQQEINSSAREEMDRSQREYFLRHQLKAIQNELGEGNELTEEIEEIRRKVVEVGMPEAVEEEVLRQVGKLERMHPDSAETVTLRNYLDWMLSIPWSVETKDNLDLVKAQGILDQDHYGLEKIKERILEYLSVRKLKKKMKGPILCFVGPPGVGKTSLGRSIAGALGRNFVRISLGGVRDEAEIRGHRRTYVGAMPGRIIQGMQQAGSTNPVFMLDEVDKLGSDYRGDPSAAMLEVLDPEQNNSFRDHYLGVPYDLSGVMFVATANLLEPIPAAFRDRMEVIRLSGYTNEEKQAICRRHVVGKQLEENGLTPEQLHITDKALLAIIEGYTSEAGLRSLEREIAGVCRKVARSVAEGKTTRTVVTPRNLKRFLGPPRIVPETSLQRDQVGVATGMAWTAAGGDILFVEASAMPGRGNLILTGQLGDVMKESAQAALSYARSRAGTLGIQEEDYFARTDVHVHVPEGAIPKDGPSAGITMATAMLSAFTGRRVRHDVSMTGEITLRGNVLPVGGIKEKVLAARRAHIKAVILPKGNSRNLEEIPPTLRKDLEFHFVETVDEVFGLALMDRAEPAAATEASRPAPPARSRRPSQAPL
ncbi:MAG: endopeptidase La [Acidobacteriota bacterium]|jgi:ATP-dependent Lon protease